MCISPITLKNKTQRLTYSNKTTSVVPCGRCVSCKQRRVNAWAFRLLEEVKISSSACFLTLTYDDDHLPIADHTNTWINYDTGEIKDYTYPQEYLKKSDFQKFLKRLRKSVPKVKYTKKNGKIGYKSNIKYYMCGEYGSNTRRPHYHAIVFNLPKHYLQNSEILLKIWGKGHIHIGDCNIATIKYTCKYINKRIKSSKNTTLPPEYSMMSKGIGLNHLTPKMVNFYKKNLNNFVTLQGGEKTPLPRYFREKIFDKIELHKIKLKQIEIAPELFEKKFNNNYKLYHEWKKDQIRKEQKANNQDRKKN